MRSLALHVCQSARMYGAKYCENAVPYLITFRFYVLFSHYEYLLLKF